MVFASNGIPRTLAAVLVMMLIGFGCGATLSDGSGEVASLGPTTVACSVIGSIRFPVDVLSGPELTREELAAEEVGRVLESFFVAGGGAEESGEYAEAEGFTVVSNELVLGYRDGDPISFFELDGESVAGWGGCQANRVDGDLVAERWYLTSPTESDAIILPIDVFGGGCVTNSGTETVTEVVSVDVLEATDQVTVTAWVRNLLGDEMCAGVGLVHHVEVELQEPLGERLLLDGGTIPASVPIS